MIIGFEKRATIDVWEYIGLMMDLEEYLQKLFGMKVHLASKSHAVQSEKWKNIEKELIYV